MNATKPLGLFGTVTALPKRKSKGPSPTARALEDLRARGWIATKVEQRISFPPKPGQRFPETILRDAFGFGDILAMHPGLGILLVQVTSGDGGNLQARVRKATAPLVEDGKTGLQVPNTVAPMVKCWIAAGGKLEFWGYAKRGKQGERKLWTLRRLVAGYSPGIKENGGLVVAEIAENAPF